MSKAVVSLKVQQHQHSPKGYQKHIYFKTPLGLSYCERDPGGFINENRLSVLRQKTSATAEHLTSV